MPDNRVPDAVFRFGECEVRIGTQELLCQGTVCELEPRAFAVLRYLIEHRDRIVSKDELLINVWNSIHLTDGVVARSIMKLRRAMRDVDAEPRYIRTAHRVGYRFVGTLLEASAAVTNSPITPDSDPVALATEMQRIALLPFSNLTGDPNYDWIELGLMTVAHRAIEGAGIPVIPIEDLIAGHGAEGETELSEERCNVLRRALGAQALLNARVQGDAATLRLEWTLYLPESAPLSDAVRGTDLPRLVIDLAERVVRAISSRSESHAHRSEFDDPFLNEAYARGMQAYHEGRYNDAHMLLDVCINAQPHPLKIEIDHFATLAEAFDARAVLLGEALLSDPSQRLAIGDKARVLEKLAILYGYLDQ